MVTANFAATVTTTLKKNLRYKPAVKLRPKFYNLTIDDPIGPTAADNLSNAIRIYSTLRQLWRKGAPAEYGVCYVKVKGEFVEIKMTRPKL